MSNWTAGGHWVTLDDGQHVLIDDNSGAVMAGLGPQNVGKTFGEIAAENESKWEARRQEYAASQSSSPAAASQAQAGPSIPDFSSQVTASTPGRGESRSISDIRAAQTTSLGDLDKYRMSVMTSVQQSLIKQGVTSMSALSPDVVKAIQDANTLYTKASGFVMSGNVNPRESANLMTQAAQAFSNVGKLFG